MTDLYRPEGFMWGTAENNESFQSLKGLREAYLKNKTLEGRVILCDGSHNLVVEMGSFKGIIPKEEATFSPFDEEVRDIAVITRVGKSVCFKITEIAENRITLSRKAAQRECYENYVKKLRAGDIIEAKITHREPFGCFCDIGAGIISLLSIDCISVSRISHPKERFYVGQYIKAVVKTPIDEYGRITLSHKELLGTWEENAGRFSAGETVAGIIRSVEPYGIFVELTPNLAGLAEWREDAEAGKAAAVYIKSIIPEKMKIKLVIVDSFAAESALSEIDYYINEGHIDKWIYSPKSSEKKIETDFTA